MKFVFVTLCFGDLNPISAPNGINSPPNPPSPDAQGNLPKINPIKANNVIQHDDSLLLQSVDGQHAIASDNMNRPSSMVQDNVVTSVTNASSPLPFADAGAGPVPPADAGAGIVAAATPNTVDPAQPAEAAPVINTKPVADASPIIDTPVAHDQNNTPVVSGLVQIHTQAGKKKHHKQERERDADSEASSDGAVHDRAPRVQHKKRTQKKTKQKKRNQDNEQSSDDEKEKESDLQKTAKIYQKDSRQLVDKRQKHWADKPDDEPVLLQRNSAQKDNHSSNNIKSRNKKQVVVESDGATSSLGEGI